jgi:formate dehydrogenase subunit gamma
MQVNATNPQNAQALAAILNENRSPVARFRLISTGISPNHCLADAGEIAGQTACVTCGNCVDACPVVLRLAGAVDLQTQRTSMYLETLVDDSCIRCYSCIKACPQVDRPLKDLAARHRLVEKVVHWWMAIAYITLAVTGIALHNFRGEWTDSFAGMVGLIHRVAAVLFVASPFIFWRFSPVLFKRTISSICRWGRKDWQWIKDALNLVLRGRKDVVLFQGEFNTGQKIWYLAILGGMFLLTVTGILKWNEVGDPGTAVMVVAVWVHVYTALTVDILFIVHLYRKFVGRLWRRTQLILHPAVKFEGGQVDNSLPATWQPQPVLSKEFPLVR